MTPATIFAIDPGNVESAWVVYDALRGKPQWMGLELNETVMRRIAEYGHPQNCCAIEMIASYGMPVGKTTFETCLWIGRFYEHWLRTHDSNPELVYRKDIKHYLCGSNKAKDSNVIQVIIDRYGGTRQEAVGVKSAPGPLYGLKKDIWQALAVAIYASEVPNA